MIILNIFFRFDGKPFAKYLEESVCSIRKRGKKNRAIRYLHYCVWAWECLKNNIRPENAQYGSPECVLSFIRKIAPGNIVAEIRDNVF